MKEVFTRFAGVLRHVENPLPLLLDRAGIKTTPYVVRTRSGLHVQLRPGRGDRFGFYETIVLNQYLRQGQRLRPGDTVIDIGANIGCFTLRAAQAVGPTGRVIALEPEQTNFESLQQNLKLNRCPNVEAMQVAVGGRAGTSNLYVRENALFGSMAVVAGAIATQQVDVVTLPDLMHRLNIARCHYLKVDCEGCEYDMFASMTRDTAERIDQITMEVHRIPGHEPQMLLARLMDLGFQLERAALLYARRSG